MGINSTSWLTSVLKGTKGLSSKTAQKLSQILKHSPIESRFFSTLVDFNQAKSLSERTTCFNQLTALQKLKQVRTIKSGEYDYYALWFHSAIRSLIGMHPFTPTETDFQKIASLVSPPLSASQVRKSLKLLQKLELVRINNQGIFELAGTAITTGENIRSLAVANFQQETMRLAQEALDRYPREERYIGTNTVGVSARSFEQIRQLLIDASNKIAEIANADPYGGRVFQINLQAFPLSKQLSGIPAGKVDDAPVYINEEEPV
jgi:uncharacterized protein (TIGR02147 family)